MIDRSVRTGAAKIQTVPDVKIKTGYRGADDLPKKAYHFVVKHPITKEELIPEIVACYGIEPTRLYILFPSNEFEVFYNDTWSLWGKTNSKKRTCDGRRCTHIIDETINGKKYPAGTEDDCLCKKLGLHDTEDVELKKQACKVDMYLKAWVLNPHTGRLVNPTPYLFESHSYYTAMNIYDELKSAKYKQYFGIIFYLEVTKKKKGNITYPLWNIYPFIPTEKLIEASFNLEIQGGDELVKLSENTNAPEESSEQKTKPKESGDEKITKFKERMDKNENFFKEPGKIKDADYKDISNGKEEGDPTLIGYKRRLDKCLSEVSLNNTLQMIFESNKSFTQIQVNELTAYTEDLKLNFGEGE